jgi:hypothetical protein
MVNRMIADNDTLMSTNPYASPQADCTAASVASEDIVRREMDTAIRLYWWMGAISLLYPAIGVVLCIGWVLNGAPLSADAAAGIIFIVVVLITSASSIHVANRLKTAPQGLLPRARLVGIIMAIWWCPVFTVPGIICVRRVTRHHTAWCVLVAEAGGETTN